MPYNESFPYSDRTRALASLLPPEMKAAYDQNSVFQQFINAMALELDNTSANLGTARDNLFAGRVDTSEIDYVYKVQHGLTLYPEDTQIVEVYDSEWREITVHDTLRAFYEDEESCIFDYDSHTLYIRLEVFNEPPVSIKINGIAVTNIVKHHVWNSIDEIALRVGLYRYDNETNSELLQRALNVFSYRGDATHRGIIFGLAGQLGLIKRVMWGSDKLELPQDTYTDSIKINERFVLNSEITGTTVQRKVLLFDREGETYATSGCVINNGIVSLEPNALVGTLHIKAINVSDLDHWDTLLMNATIPQNSSISVDIIDGYDSNVYFATGITLTDPGNGIYSIPMQTNSDPPQNISVEVALRITLRRQSRSVQSPTISSILASYVGKECTVSYIQKSDISLNELHDEEWKAAALFDNRGFPTEQMKQYVNELSGVAPIFWGRWRWDEAYWDIVDKSLMGVDALPTMWDSTLDPISQNNLQPGIGDTTDLKPRIGENLDVHLYGGTYYIGNDLEEHYLFASPKTETFPGPASTVVTSKLPLRGAPIIVKADGTYLTHVSFLDDNYDYTITNTEQVDVVEEDGHRYAYLTYRDIDIDSLAIEGCTVIAESYTRDNRVEVSNDSPLGEAEASYRIKDSFCVNFGESTATIMLSEPMENIEVVYEESEDTPYNTSLDLTVDPLNTHITSGFIYLTQSQPVCSRLDVRAHPDSLLANGIDRAIVHVDCYDAYDNPVFNEDISATANYGTIIKVGTSGNRTTFRYTVPSSAPIGHVDTINVQSNTTPTVTSQVTIEVR